MEKRLHMERNVFQISFSSMLLLSAARNLLDIKMFLLLSAIIPFYFTDSYFLWQQGSNENANGLIREFLPKGVDMTHAPRQFIFNFIHKLNPRSNKCLHWKALFEVFFDCRCT